MVPKYVVQDFKSFALEIPFRVFDFAHTLHVVRQFNAFIVPGTGIFDDFCEPWQAMPYDLFKWSIAAKSAGRPFIFVSVGAGPIRHPISCWLLKSASLMAHYRSYRDDASKNYMLTLGVPAERDLVFPILLSRYLHRPAAPNPSRDGRLITVGVGVMRYFGWDHASANRLQIYEAYLSRMTEFVCWLHEHGYRIRLLMGSAF